MSCVECPSVPGANPFLVAADANPHPHPRPNPRPLQGDRFLVASEKCTMHYRKQNPGLFVSLFLKKSVRGGNGLGDIQ